MTLAHHKIHSTTERLPAQSKTRKHPQKSDREASRNDENGGLSGLVTQHTSQRMVSNKTSHTDISEDKALCVQLRSQSLCPITHIMYSEGVAAK